MKIVHINTYDYGGAANAAINIHESLLSIGIDSHFLCLHDSGRSINNKVVFSKLILKSSIKKILHKLRIYKTQTEKNKKEIQQNKGEFEQFTFYKTDYRVNNHPLIQTADIIHLHWVANFIDYQSFFNHISKPVIWTLHDKNPVMGGLHLFIDKSRKNNIQKIEQEYQLHKYRILNQYSKLFIVAPSSSLMQFSKATLPTKKHYNIYNPVNTENFRVYVQQYAKKLLGFDINKILILSFAYNKVVHHKGTDLLIQAIKKVNKQTVDFTLIGQTDICVSLENTNITQKITDNRLLAIWYSAADAFIISSREENLPNTMLEAMACGTPVISFPVGGMAEIIKNGFNGILANQISAASLAEAIEQFIERKNKFNREKIREFARQNFAPEKIANKYIELYKSVL